MFIALFFWRFILHGLICKCWLPLVLWSCCNEYWDAYICYAIAQGSHLD